MAGPVLRDWPTFVIDLFFYLVYVWDKSYITRENGMRKNLHEIRNIQEAMYKLQDAVDKFDGCVASDVRHSTDKDIADEMYHIAKELNVCIVSLATKRDDESEDIDMGLLIAVVNQIEMDREDKDYTAIECLFQYLDQPEERLRGFLREEADNEE